MILWRFTERHSNKIVPAFGSLEFKGYCRQLTFIASTRSGSSGQICEAGNVFPGYLIPDLPYSFSCARFLTFHKPGIASSTFRCGWKLQNKKYLIIRKKSLRLYKCENSSCNKEFMHKSRKSKKYRGYSARIVEKSKLKYRKTTSVKGKFYGIFSNFSWYG